MTSEFAYNLYSEESYIGLNSDNLNFDVIYDYLFSKDKIILSTLLDINSDKCRMQIKFIRLSEPYDCIYIEYKIFYMNELVDYITQFFIIPDNEELEKYGINRENFFIKFCGCINVIYSKLKCLDIDSSSSFNIKLKYATSCIYSIIEGGML